MEGAALITNIFIFLLNKSTGSYVRVGLNQAQKSISIAFNKMSEDLSIRGLSLLESLKFELRRESCSFVEPESILHCVPERREAAILTQGLQPGEEVYLVKFSSYPLRGKFFDEGSGELKEIVVYKTSVVFEKEGRLLTFNFQGFSDSPQDSTVLPQLLSSKL